VHLGVGNTGEGVAVNGNEERAVRGAVRRARGQAVNDRDPGIRRPTERAYTDQSAIIVRVLFHLHDSARVESGGDERVAGVTAGVSLDLGDVAEVAADNERRVGTPG